MRRPPVGGLLPLGPIDLRAACWDPGGPSRYFDDPEVAPPRPPGLRNVERAALSGGTHVHSHRGAGSVPQHSSRRSSRPSLCRAGAGSRAVRRRNSRPASPATSTSGVDVTPSKNAWTSCSPTPTAIRCGASGRQGIGAHLHQRSTGATLSSRSNGVATQTFYNPDGSFTVTLTGHNLLILFPTDVPAGPTHELYVGRVTFDVDRRRRLHGHRVVGETVDVCVTELARGPTRRSPGPLSPSRRRTAGPGHT